MKLFKINMLNLLMLIILLLLLNFSYGLHIPISKVLNKNKPHKVEILNKELVVWWNKHDKKWNALDDMCLHRQASLSKGIISKEGNIKCGYHGWEYNNCGKCTYFPSTDKALDLKVDNYDIFEKQNLLWLNTNDTCENKFMIDNIFQTYMFTEWMVADVDGSHDLYMENTMDSLHFNHVHDGTPPPISRYNELHVVGEDEVMLFFYDKRGFSIRATKRATYTFIAPYSLLFEIDGVTIFACIVPINEGKTRFISNLLLPKKKGIKKLTSKFSYLLSKPFIQLIGNKIFAQDVEQIIAQDNHVQKNGKKYISNYIADRPIFLYNKWQKEYEGL